MHQTSRIRVLGFYVTEFHELWCLSISTGGYQKKWREGPHVMFTTRNSILNLEESRSNGNERETGRARGQGARLPPWAPALTSGPIRTKLLDHAPPT